MVHALIKKAGLLFFGVICSGCAMQADVIDIQKDVTGLNSQLSDFKKEVRDELHKEDQSLRRDQADIGEHFNVLQQSQQRLQGLWEESQYHFRKSTEKIDSLELELGLRLSQIEEKFADLENRIKVIEKHLSIKTSPLLRPPPREVKALDKYKKNNEEARLEKEITHDLFYQIAYENLKKGMIDSAKEDFKKYLKLYPHTDLADNAQYWLGECFYVQGKYEEAILEFDKVIKNYPEGDKVAGALLKEGLSFYGIGDKANARVILQKVIDNYPRSPQAIIAEKRLKEIR